MSAGTHPRFGGNTKHEQLVFILPVLNTFSVELDSLMYLGSMHMAQCYINQHTSK